MHLDASEEFCEIISHAHERGKSEKLCRVIFSWNESVHTLGKNVVTQRQLCSRCHFRLLALLVTHGNAGETESPGTRVIDEERKIEGIVAGKENFPRSRSGVKTSGVVGFNNRDINHDPAIPICILRHVPRLQESIIGT